MNKNDYFDAKLIITPCYYKLLSSSRIYEPIYLDILRYIGAKYYTKKINASHEKRGILYLHEKTKLSKTSLKLWYKTQCSFMNSKEYAFISKKSDKIFEEIYRLMANDLDLRNLVGKLSTTKYGTYYDIVPHHAALIGDYSNCNSDYINWVELYKLKEKLEGIR